MVQYDDTKPNQATWKNIVSVTPERFRELYLSATLAVVPIRNTPRINRDITITPHTSTRIFVILQAVGIYQTSRTNHTKPPYRLKRI